MAHKHTSFCVSCGRKATKAFSATFENGREFATCDDPRHHPNGGYVEVELDAPEYAYTALKKEA